MKKPLLITIDGPAGAGKTTASKALAERLGYRYVDTGALYRGVAVQTEAVGLAIDDNDGLEQLCRHLKLTFEMSNHRGLRLYANGADITDQIRTPEISMLASAVSARSVVRKYLLKIQREIGRGKEAVFEGRDMGTVVFPAADVKFFLTASHKIRAQRRFRDLAYHAASTIESVEEDIKQRDQNDSTRDLAPLKPAQDAIYIDSSDMSMEEVVELMLFHVAKAI
ncbi:(d)CMP kinase [Thermodesulfobacteriota bacterium]